MGLDSPTALRHPSGPAITGCVVALRTLLPLVQRDKLRDLVETSENRCLAAVSALSRCLVAGLTERRDRRAFDASPEHVVGK